MASKIHFFICRSSNQQLSSLEWLLQLKFSCLWSWVKCSRDPRVNCQKEIKCGSVATTLAHRGHVNNRYNTSLLSGGYVAGWFRVLQVVPRTRTWSWHSGRVSRQSTILKPHKHPVSVGRGKGMLWQTERTVQTVRLEWMICKLGQYQPLPPIPTNQRWDRSISARDAQSVVFINILSRNDNMPTVCYADIKRFSQL